MNRNGNSPKQLEHLQKYHFKSAYSPQEQLKALIMLDSSQRDYQGENMPEFRETAEMLNISEATLRNWWRDREKLLLKFKELVTQANLNLSLRLQDSTETIIEKMNNYLETGDLSKERLKDFSSSINALVKSSRLMAGLSTNNTAVNATVTNRVEMIEPRKEK